MLTRGRVALLVCSVAMTLPNGVARADDPTPIVVTGDTHPGAVDTVVTAPGSPALPVSNGPGSSSSASGGGVTCTWTAESDYSQQLFQWLGSDPDGAWYDVACSDGTTYTAVYVPPAAANIPPAVVLAGVMARTAANQLVLPKPAARRNPAGPALVNLATWLWLDPAGWRPLTQRTQAGPVWAQVTATPTSTTWDPGDGSAPVVCDGPGTPYDTDRAANAQATDCSYTYRRTSGDQPQTGPSVNDRFFTVTVTTTWQVTWVGVAGTRGTLPVLTTSSSFPLAVAQRQTVVTGGSG